MAVNTGLVGSFSEFKDLKNIDRPTLMKVLDDVFRTLLRKKYNSDENFDIIVNTDKGDLEIWRKREIVPDDEVVDSNKQVAYSEAVKIEEDFEIGEELYEQINLLDFGRRAILSARQTLMSRITELQKDELYRKYSERIGEIVSGEVYQVWQKELLVLDDDENELILPKSEMIHGDIYKKGDAIRAIVKKVEMRNSTTPRIILSRTSNGFWQNCWNWKCPKFSITSYLLNALPANPAKEPKLPLNLPMTGLTP